MVFAVS